MAAVHALNRPDPNLIGTCEPAIYGSITLADIEERRRARLGIVLNGGAHTHASLGLHDAIREVGAIDARLSNVRARESLRHYSHISPIAKNMITGLGPSGSEPAVEALADLPRDRG